MIRIVIADDDGIIRQGMTMILESQDDFEVVGTCKNGREAVEVCRQQQPDIALLDIRMPDMSGIDAAKELQEEQVRILLLTTFDEPELIISAMKTRVHGYILKNSSAETILSAIRTVALGGTVFQKDVMDFISNQINVPKSNHLFDELTQREHDVARLISEGCTNKQIAEKLFISEGTVRNHISTILSKTSLEHRTQIAVQYLKLGL